MRIVLACLVVAGVARETAHAQPTIEIFGIGMASCAAWASDPKETTEGVGWILGFWSGLNIQNTEHPKVGSSTDGAGIVGEVRRQCEREPSVNLITAVKWAYDKLEKAGR